MYFYYVTYRTTNTHYNGWRSDGFGVRAHCAEEALKIIKEKLPKDSEIISFTRVE
jgi:hypothetical protein